ncbi:two-component sensor histidine kinase [Clostridium sp. 19966]|uniref:sensor histidine kinase n=1 Tax=Clostridium sp. 19966 TaxID=2768166 RepID=UPI0028E0008C|nr:ATP-binding protein [Clostridium sp. 19966]MDT8715378.1 two-component sensor histidine kinase [Clostridium sp. 19966]
MAKSLRFKLSLSYMLLTIICVVLICSFLNLFLKTEFKNFVIAEQDSENKNIVKNISMQYLAGSHQKWNTQVIGNIGFNAIDKGLFITVKDASGKIIWDASTYDYDKCEIVKKHLTASMVSRYPNWKGMYTKNSYEITNSKSVVGSIDIGYFGPYFYTDNEIMFLNTLNNIVLGIGSVVLIVALILGFLMARGLSTPILSVIKSAKMLSIGNFNEKVNKKADITEINELILTINNLGASLHEQEIMRKRLTKDVSHELRTPLTTVHSHIEAMMDGLWQPTPERLASCQEEIERLMRLVGDLETLSKYESENLILSKTKFNISEAIKNIVLNFQNEFINKQVKLRFYERAEKVYGDKDKINQVIINLLSNALKYTPKGGEVQVFIGEDKEYILVKVRDNGIGIAEKDISHVFDRFYRADESRNRKTGGSGIGLTIAKAIVDAHRGTFKVESKVGEGTEFTVGILKKM